MNQEKTKKAVELAEKELQEEEEKKQVELIKKAIKQTLENIKEKEKERDKLNKEIKTLKQDMDNIRNGRLDLIAERQEKDEGAKKTSIIEVIKTKDIHHHHYHDRWYEPYKIIIKEPYYATCGWITYDSNTISNLSTGTLTDAAICSYQTVTNSIAKDSWAGTYELNSGDCVTLI